MQTKNQNEQFDLLWCTDCAPCLVLPIEKSNIVLHVEHSVSSEIKGLVGSRTFLQSDLDDRSAITLESWCVYICKSHCKTDDLCDNMQDKGAQCSNVLCHSAGCLHSTAPFSLQHLLSRLLLVG